MATMNHTNLTTYKVPALTEFFCSVFGGVEDPGFGGSGGNHSVTEHIE
jgi:hypothetical protein